MNFLKSTMVILVLMILTTGLHGQTMLQKIKKLEKADKIDSVFLIISAYSDKYQETKSWDSLTITQIEHIKLAYKYKNVNDVKLIIDKFENNVRQHLPKDNKYLLNMLLEEADYFGDIGRLLDAEKLYKEILTLTTQMKDDYGITDITNSEYGFLNLRMGNPEAAKEKAKKAYTGIMSGKDTASIINLTRTLSIAHHWMHEYNDAIKYCEKLVQLSKKYYGENHPNTGLMIDNLAGIYDDLGNSKMALENYNKAKQIQISYFNKTGNSRLLTGIIGNLGNYYINLGEHKLAIDHLKYALEMEIKNYGDESLSLIWNYNVLCTACRLYKDLDQAEYYHLKAKNIILKSDQPSEYDLIRNRGFEAELLYERDRFEKALPIALKVHADLDKNSDIGNPKDRLHILNLISNIYIGQKNWTEARKWSDINIEWHNNNFGKLNGLRTNVLASALDIAIANKDVDYANQLKNSILKIRHNGSGKYLFQNCIPNEEMLNFAAKWASFLSQNLDSEESNYTEYFSFLEDFEKYYPLHLTVVKTNSSLASNERYLRLIYAPAIAYYLKSDPAKALLTLEKFKSFKTRQILQSQLINDPQLPTLDLTDYNSESVNDSISAAIFISITGSLDTLQMFKDSLIKTDNLKYEKYFGIQSNNISSLKEVLSDKEEIMINFFEEDSIITVFYQNHIKTEVRILDKMVIEKLITKSNRGDIDNRIELSKLLIPEDIIAPYENLLVIPDGLISEISFDALLYQNDLLIRRKKVRYAQSATILSYQNKLALSLKNPRQILGLTPGFTQKLKSNLTDQEKLVDTSFNYLIQQPFLLALSEDLSNNFDMSESFTEDLATEKAFNEHASDYRILHIATHGILNQDAPLFSKLIFAKDSIEDGYLHAYELYTKNLNADLAVLSACSSGIENKFGLEGLVSLTQAFTHAGCPSVLMTKWDVDEKSTSIILDSFYKNLKAGQIKSEALRNAKLSFLDSAPQELQEPYYWAGLVLIGSDEALFAKTNYLRYFIAVIVVMLLLIVFFKRRKNIT